MTWSVALPAIFWGTGAGLGLRCCKEMSGATEGEGWHRALALRFQTPRSETSSTSFILGPEDGSIRYILNALYLNLYFKGGTQNRLEV